MIRKRLIYLAALLSAVVITSLLFVKTETVNSQDLSQFPKEYLNNSSQALPEIVLDETLQPFTPVNHVYGNFSNRLGVATNFRKPEQHDWIYSSLSSAKIKWVRLDLPWIQIEPSPGIFDFSYYDDVLDQLENRGISALLILDYGHPIYTNCDLPTGCKNPPRTEEEIEAFTRYAKKAAEHYLGRDIAFEVWNEPDLSHYWPPASDVNEYFTLLSATVPEIRKVNPDVKIFSGAIYQCSNPFYDDLIQLGGINLVDGVAANIYTQYIYQWPGRYQECKSYLDANMMEIPPIWNTEWSYHSPENIASQYLTQWYLGLERSFYYSLIDYGTGIGLILPDYQEKPDLQAVRNLSLITENRSFTGKLDLGIQDIYGIRLDGTNDVLAAFWTLDPSFTVSMPTGSTAVDVYGNPITPIPNGDNVSFNVIKADGPIYVTCPSCDLLFQDVFADHWAFSYIYAIRDGGISSGYPDNTYRPSDPVTRAEMAVFLLNSMGISPSLIDKSHPFSDIKSHWAEAYIEELFDQSITGGYPDGTYRPEALVTRAEMAVFLLKAMGITPPALECSHPFTDVAGHWAEIFIEELFDQAITGGYPDGTYRPENRVTRAEMAVFLVNTFNIPIP